MESQINRGSTNSFSRNPIIMLKLTTRSIHPMPSLKGATTTSNYKRRVPQPSPSMLAMQAKGLELPFKNNEMEMPIEEDVTTTTEALQIPTVYGPSTSLVRSRFSETSSMYSTDSMGSAVSKDSMDSLETTISQIVEMYTNLVDKIPCDDNLSNVSVFQPKAYRDTVAPLLKRRFSSGHVTNDVPIPAIPFSCEPDSHAASLLRPSDQKAPAFQEFSRNLRKQRAEAVSPCSMINPDRERKMSVSSSSSILSLANFPERPFSFINGHVDDALSMINDWRSVSPLSVAGLVAPITMPTSSLCVGEVENIDSAEVGSEQIPSNKLSLRYIMREDIQDRRSSPRPRRVYQPPRSSSPRIDLEQHYRDYSTGSAPSENQIVQISLSGVVKELFKGKTRQREVSQSTAMTTSKLSAETTTQATEGERLGDNRHQTPWKTHLEATRQQNWAPGTPEKHLAVSGCEALVTKDRNSLEQKHEMKVWFAKSELSYRNKRSRQQDKHKPDAVVTKPRSKSNEHRDQPKHGRVSSLKSAGTPTSNISHPRKYSILTALEDAKHSLIQSSAEKRREKLKESITIVGPTELTVANALPSGRSL